MAKTRGRGGRGRAKRGAKCGGKAPRETHNVVEDTEQPEEIEELRYVGGDTETTPSEAAEGTGNTMHRGQQNTDSSEGSARGKEPAEEARGKRATQQAGQEGLTEENDGIGDLDRDIEEELGELIDPEPQLVGVWTMQKEDKLIDYYRRCVFLYDQSHPSFKLRNKKDLAYEKISQLVGVTGKLNNV